MDRSLKFFLASTTNKISKNPDPQTGLETEIVERQTHVSKYGKNPDDIISNELYKENVKHVKSAFSRYFVNYLGNSSNNGYNPAVQIPEENDISLSSILMTIYELSKIDDMIKIKIDNTDVLFYSKSGSGNNIIAFKSFIYPIQEFIISDENIELDFIITNSRNFVENMKLLTSKDGDIVGQFTYTDKSKLANQLLVSNGKLKFNFITGDYRIIKDITKNEIEMKMDPTLCEYHFNIPKDEFEEIKKLTRLNKSETVNIKVKNNKLSFYDKNWSNYICDVDSQDGMWTFGNKYFKTITGISDITIYMFDQFLLFKEDNITFMIGLELSNL